ncbi:MAG: hypothetical protein MUF45_16780 [Spirosomaceae bacterium]|nr:hypothetical protein [Spirosomataceae bacterium]
MPLCLYTMLSCGSTDLSPDSSGKYFIKAKLNGELVEYDVNANFQNDPSRTLSATAFKSSSSNFPSLGFTIESSEPISKKSYQETDPSINLIFVYSLAGSESFNSQMGEEQDFKIEVTEINKEFVKGKFGGTIRKASGNNINSSIEIKDGEFYLSKEQ